MVSSNLIESICLFIVLGGEVLVRTFRSTITSRLLAGQWQIIIREFLLNTGNRLYSTSYLKTSFVETY